MIALELEVVFGARRKEDREQSLEQFWSRSVYASLCWRLKTRAKAGGQFCFDCFEGKFLQRDQVGNHDVGLPSCADPAANADANVIGCSPS